jgi:hypothetical protein
MLRRPFHYSRRFLLVSVQAAALFVPEFAAAQTPAPAPAPAADSASQSRYQRAKQAGRLGNWRESRKLLLELWSEKPTYQIAKDLVTVEYNLANDASAGNFLLYVLAHVPPSEDPTNIEDFKRNLDQLRERAATTLITAPPEAEVTLDGEPIPMTGQPVERFITIGTHIVKGRLGDEVMEERIYGTAGHPFPVVLKFKDPPQPSEPAAFATPAPSEPQPREKQAGRSMVPVYIGAAVTGVALATGTGFALSAESKNDEYLDLKNKVGSGCPNGTASRADCDALQDADQTRDTHATIANIGFGLGALAGVVTLTYLLWPESSDTEKPALRAGGMVGSSSGSVTITYDF